MMCLFVIKVPCLLLSSL